MKMAAVEVAEMTAAVTTMSAVTTASAAAAAVTMRIRCN